MRPTSVGRVSLRSADPREPPSILFNYMATEGDRQEMRAAVRLTREIFAQRAFDPYLGPELAPGAEVETDAEIDAFVRARAESAYHACGTCKMGLDSDPSAVVDGNCRVYGVQALRVVDAGVMPSIVSGNTNAPTIMLAERASDLIRGRQPLAAARRPGLHRAELGDKAAVRKGHPPPNFAVKAESLALSSHFLARQRAKVKPESAAVLIAI